MFMLAPSVEWVIAARAVQGVAVGVVTAAYTASLVELATPGTRVGPVVAAAAPVGGLGLGALFGGIAVELWDRNADEVLFSVVAALVVLGLVVTVLAPETTTRVPGALRSLIPQVVVPASARSFFVRMLPILIAAWATGSLFLGLAPTVVHGILHVDSGFIDGFTGSIHGLSVCIGSIVFGRVAVTRALRGGAAGLVIGVGVIVVGILTATIALVWVGGVIEALAFGAAFGAIFRGLAPLAPEHQRAGTFAGCLRRRLPRPRHPRCRRRAADRAARVAAGDLGVDRAHRRARRARSDRPAAQAAARHRDPVEDLA